MSTVTTTWSPSLNPSDGHYVFTGADSTDYHVFTEHNVGSTYAYGWAVGGDSTDEIPDVPGRKFVGFCESCILESILSNMVPITETFDLVQRRGFVHSCN